jgi:hypothetical protein
VTRAEYLEFVEEMLAFKREPWDAGEWKPLINNGESYPDPGMQLRESKEITEALRKAHREYCNRVEAILFPERRPPNPQAEHGMCA